MAGEVPAAEREARLRFLEEAILALLAHPPRGASEEAIRANVRMMQWLYRDEQAAAAKNLLETEPPAWIEVAARKITEHWVEVVTREAAP